MIPAKLYLHTMLGRITSNYNQPRDIVETGACVIGLYS